jgi:ATP-dependent exoDNAse (exonuclease V) alpha subunit
MAGGKNRKNGERRGYTLLRNVPPSCALSGPANGRRGVERKGGEAPMALYRFEAKVISRGGGRSTVGSAAYRTGKWANGAAVGTGKCVTSAAAYRAGAVLEDERTGQRFDYTRKRGVLGAEIMLPEGAPSWMADRSALWNAIEIIEKRKDAQLARDFILSLPHELNHEQRVALTRDFVREQFCARGYVADIAWHAPEKAGGLNWHAHVMTPMRQVEGAGFARKKERTREDGIKHPAAIWKQELARLREAWAHSLNHHLALAGLDIVIDHRSLEAQGIEREPEPKQGPLATKIEREGRESLAGARRREVQARNAERARLEAEFAKAKWLEAQVIDLMAYRQRNGEDKLDQLIEHIRARDAESVIEDLTERQATFTRKELDSALAYTGLDESEREHFRLQILAHHEVIPLRETADGPITRYTTRTILAAERSIQRDAWAMIEDWSHGLTDRRIKATAAAHKLDAEQRDALAHAAGPTGFTIISGEAGTGKSRALAAVRDAYEADGFRVVGMAWTNQVVADMRAAGYREATTIASELKRLEFDKASWDREMVFVIDEASMLSTKTLADVVGNAREAGAKVILSGDEKQLGSIERGGMFEPLKHEFGAAELHDVKRVYDPEQKRAFNRMHEGQFQSALEIFEQQGRIKWAETLQESVGAFGEQYARDCASDPAKSRFIFAYTNEQVDLLNQFARTLCRESGQLGKDHVLAVERGLTCFATGDRVQFTDNGNNLKAKDAGLVNGAIGTLRGIDETGPKPRVTIELDSENKAEAPRVTFTVGDDREAGEFNAFRHGYAGTIHKGQGRTLDQTYVFHSPHWRAASSYVALTRHREAVTIFVSRDTAKDLQTFARQISRPEGNWAASAYVIDAIHLERSGLQRLPAEMTSEKPFTHYRVLGTRILDAGKPAQQARPAKERNAAAEHGLRRSVERKAPVGRIETRDLHAAARAVGGVAKAIGDLMGGFASLFENLFGGEEHKPQTSEERAAAALEQQEEKAVIAAALEEAGIASNQRDDYDRGQRLKALEQLFGRELYAEQDARHEETRRRERGQSL